MSESKQRGPAVKGCILLLAGWLTHIVMVATEWWLMVVFVGAFWIAATLLLIKSLWVNRG